MGISNEDFERMKARVAGAVVQAVEPVRARLPMQFTIIGHAVSLNDYRTVADGRMFKSAAGRAWDKLMLEQLRAQWGG